MNIDNLLGQLNQEIGLTPSQDTFFMMECNADTECQHNFQIGLGFDTTRCSYCNWFPAKDKRAQCLLCSKTYCIVCLEKLNMTHKITLGNSREDHSLESRELHLTIRDLELQVRELKLQIHEIETKTSFDIECLELENS